MAHEDACTGARPEIPNTQSGVPRARNRSIRIRHLQTADCRSMPSKRMYTLTKMTVLALGTEILGCQMNTLSPCSIP